MTSLIAWVGVDSHGPASIYLATDSRISWGDKATWNYGRKLFASSKYPEIIGYVGDVLFPSLVLGQIIDLIDNNTLFNLNDLPQNKLEKLVLIIQQAFNHYPLYARQNFSVVYSTRSSEGMKSEFHLFVLDFDKSLSGYKVEKLKIPERSSHIQLLGSGEHAVNRQIQNWQNSSQGGTSRSVFSAFCDSVRKGEDKYSGGAPQLVGLYRIHSARTFGVIFNDERFLLGLPAIELDELDNVEWRNELFERCDFRTKRPFLKAQRHARPTDIDNA